MTRVLLTTTPTDMSYEHCLDFESTRSQYQYYYNRPGARLINLNIPGDAYRVEFEVDLSIDEMALYDYCVVIGQGMDYYYFITSRIQRGTYTIVNVELDVLNTYYFYMQFNDSFVNRCHVDRWTDNGLPTANYEDEGMEYGPMVIQKQEMIKQCPLNFIICSSTPIGKLPSYTPPSSGGEDENYQQRLNVVNSARKLIGKPYVFGGNYPPLGSSEGTDCSGLVQWAYNDNDIKISRTTYTQIKEGEEVNSPDDLLPADIIFTRFENGQPEHEFLLSKKENGKLYCVEAKMTGTLISEHEFTWQTGMRARRIIKYVPSGGATSGDWQKGIPSKELFRFIKGYEGFAPNLYNDSGGVATIGYGITGSEPTQFNKLKANQPCSEELCAQTAWEVLPKRYGSPIVEAVKSYGITKQQQFDALVDLSYNAGTGRILNPNGDLSKAIKRDPNDEGYIRPIWENYIIKDAQGTVLQGLKLRRKAECDMYFQGKYEKRKIPIVGSGGAITGSFEGDGWLPS